MTAVASVISMVGLAYLVYLYNDHRVDHLRQDLFALRDMLFDEARAGKIAFTSPTYGATRDLLNGGIRFAHRFSLSRFFAFRWIMNAPSDRRRSSGFVAHFNLGSKADIDLCSDYVRRANLRMAAHLVRSPYVVIFWGWPLLAFEMLGHSYNVCASFVKRWRTQFAILDDVAYRAGVSQASLNDSAFAKL